MITPIPLPYAYNALEPYYDEETLKVHYDKLYKGYIDNLNKTEDKLQKARIDRNFENIKCLEKDLSFNGSGVILHELFFTNMAPRSARSEVNSGPSEYLLGQINNDFGSFENFKAQFIAAAKVVEASGWCLLVWDTRFQKLEILQCEKHQNLTLWGCTPILVLDMWEHSYFLKHKSDRGSYINDFWNIINWNLVNKRFDNV